MSETKVHKFDLEERTFKFAKLVRDYIKELPKTLVNYDDVKQLLRASGSIGANYIEANESLSKKDFTMRIKICRKEAKECIYWLNLIQEQNQKTLGLVREAQEIMNIFGAIVRKLEQSCLDH